MWKRKNHGEAEWEPKILEWFLEEVGMAQTDGTVGMWVKGGPEGLSLGKEKKRARIHSHTDEKRREA